MEKGADILFVTPSGDVFADPGTYTAMGYLMLFHFLEEKYGLNVTWSTYASEGGNFGFFTSHETMKRLNAKMYAEAKRLRVKWILGGECGHMWRVIHQYMDTMNGPGRPPGGAGEPDHRHALRERALDQDGAHRRVHRRPDPQRQARTSTRAATTTSRSPSTTPATRRAAWACSTSRAT